MGAYIIGIVGATIISSVISVLTPEKWDKYVGVVTGIVITLCIARPIISLMNEDFFTEASHINQTITAEGTEIFAAEIKKEMQSKIAMDVKERLKTEFGKTCVARAEVNVTPEGKVLGVEEILVRGDKIDAVAKSRLREIYGAREIRYEGP